MTERKWGDTPGVPQHCRRTDYGRGVPSFSLPSKPGLGGGSPPQKNNFNANCNTLGSFAAVILPKVTPEDTVALGF